MNDANARRSTGSVGLNNGLPPAGLGDPVDNPDWYIHWIAVKNGWVDGTSAKYGAAGVTVGCPSYLYKNDANAWRPTGFVGRKVPSSNPVVIPDVANHMISVRNG